MGYMPIIQIYCAKREASDSKNIVSVAIFRYFCKLLNNSILLHERSI